MAIRPSQPEIITVNSETLQTTIRDLLPSQNGFGSELQASNVITPIIDLTASAEGTTVPVQLQEALSFTDVTAASVVNTTTTLLNSPGFYLVEYQVGLSATNARARLQLSNSGSNKNIVDLKFGSDKGALITARLTVFLRAGDSLIGISANTNSTLNVTTRQIADGDGTLLNPTGFPL